ncbi:MAG: hypothetical protein HY553_22555, partial [Elusimicrobia bacterium]|nr:hypothetical protein [Elusimicrobiota bacterium]
MRRLILPALLVAACAAPSEAAVPQKIGYQGFLRESGGLAVGNKKMRFKIYPSSQPAAVAVYDSGEMTVTVSTGVFHVTLDVTGVDLEAATAWLEIAVGNASASTVLSPREQLTASAYALNAFRVEGKRFISSGTAPGGAISPGDLWFDDANNVLYYRSGGGSPAWVTTAGAGLPVDHAAEHAQGGGDQITSLGGVTFTANVGFAGAPSATKIDVHGDAQFGLLAKSTFTSSGGLFIARNSSVTLSGPAGWIVGGSSIVASGFFGDGSGLTNVSGVTAGTVDSTKLAKDSVDSEKVVAASIARSHLVDLTVDSRKLAAGAIDSEKLASGAVQKTHLADLAVETAKLAADSVSSATLLPDAASLARVSAGAVVSDGVKVAVGAASPNARLHVSQSAATGADTVFLVSSGTAAGQELFSIKGDGRIVLGSTVTFSAAVAGTSASFTPNVVSESVSGNLGAGDMLRNEDARFIAVGSDGFARLVFYDNGYTDLKFARCTNLDCTASNVTVIATEASGVDQPSLELGPDGFARIAFINYKTPNELRFIQCTNDDCSTRVDTLVDTSDSDGQAGFWATSIALGSDGFARIVYDNYDNGAQGAGIAKVKLARCSDAGCTVKTITTVATGVNWLELSAVSMGLDGFPRIAYGSYGSVPRELRFIRCADDTCATKTDTLVDTGAGLYYLDLDKDASGLGLIAYTVSTGLKLAHCTNPDCSAKVLTLVDSSAIAEDDFSRWSQASMRAGPDGFPRIAFNTGDSGGGFGGVRYVRCTNADCSNRSKAYLGAGVFPTSLAIGPDGLARAAFATIDGRTLVVVRLASDAGTSNVTGSNLGSEDAPYGEAAITRVTSQELKVSGGSANALALFGTDGSQVFTVDTATSPPAIRGSIVFPDPVAFTGRAGSLANFGAGTASPATKLHVVSSATYVFPNPGQQIGMLHLTAPDPNGATTALTFGGPGGYANTALSGIYSVNAFSGGANLHLASTEDFNAGAKVRMTVKNDGLVDVLGAARVAGAALSGDGLFVGNDSKLVDIDQADTLGLYGVQDATKGKLKLGSGGPILAGANGGLDIAKAAGAGALLSVSEAAASYTGSGVAEDGVNRPFKFSPTGNPFGLNFVSQTTDPGSVITSKAPISLYSFSGGGSLAYRSGVTLAAESNSGSVRLMAQAGGDGQTKEMVRVEGYGVRVGDGTSQPAATLDVVRTAPSGATPIGDTVLSAQSNSHTAISVLGPDGANVGLTLGTDANNNIGGVGYSGPIKTMHVGALARRKVNLVMEGLPLVTLSSSNYSVGINQPDPQSKLHISSGLVIVDGNGSGLDVTGTLSIRAPDGLAGGTISSMNGGGGTLYHQPAPTGGNGALHVFKTRSGSEILYHNNDGQTVYKGFPQAGASAAGEGAIYFDSGLKRFRVSQDGGNWADLGTTGDLRRSSGVFYVDGVTGNTQSAVVIGTQALVSTAMLQVGNATFTVLQSGSVGIGTASPGGKLSVAGTLGTFQVDATGADITMSRPARSYIFATDPLGSIALGAANVADVVVISETGAAAQTLNVRDGRVGVGAPVPATKLDVRAGAAADILTLGNDNGVMSVSADGSTFHIARVSGNNTLNLTNGWNIVNLPAMGCYSTNCDFGGHLHMFNSKNIRVYSDQGITQTGVWESGSGFLGLGTNAPASRLHVSTGMLLIDGDSGSMEINQKNVAANDRYLRVRADDATVFDFFRGSDGSTDKLAVGDLQLTSTREVGSGSGGAVTVNPGFSGNAPLVVSQAGSGPQVLVRPQSGSQTGDLLRVSSGVFRIDGVSGNTQSAVVVGTQPLITNAMLQVGSATFTVLQSGNIGVGLSAPTARLDVAGGGPQLGLSDGASPCMTFSVGTTNSIINSCNSNFRVQVGGSDAIWMKDTTQNVGFSVDPTAKLHVLQTSAADALLIQDEAGDTTPFVIDQDGDVGVGRATPAAKLDVDGDLISRIPSGPAAGTIQFQTGHIGNAAAYLEIFTDGGGAGNGKTRIGSWENDVTYLQSAGGNVGIGTEIPLAPLHVNAEAGSNPSAYVSDADVAHGLTGVVPTNVVGALTTVDSGAGGLVVQGLTDADGVTPLNLYGTIGVNDPTDSVAAIDLRARKSNGGTGVTSLGSLETALTVTNAGSSLLAILGGGNVGIGTAGPGALLDVSGDGATILLPRKSAAGDPASPANGMIYYNSNSNRFRCYEGGSWKDCISSGSSSYTEDYALKTADFTPSTTESFIACDASGGAIVASLPAAATAGAGRVYTIKKIDSTANACTL